MGGLASAIVGGVVGWFGSNFLADPILQFRTLRSEIAATIGNYDDVGPITGRPSVVTTPGGSIAEELLKTNSVVHSLVN
jgi:hypothetical protein